MQNGLRISNRESFLQRIAPNHHEVTLKYLAFKDQFSQKWQLYPVHITVYFTDFFQHNSFCTGHRLMKKHLSLKNTMLKQSGTLPTAASLPSASWTPSHCHTCISNFFVMGAPGSASFCCLKLPHKAGVPRLCLSRPLLCTRSSWATGCFRKHSSVEHSQDIFY